MTNEEAIKMIRDDMRLHHDSLSGTYRKALNMAIESLKQVEDTESVVRCKDCMYYYDTGNQIPCDQGYICDYYHWETRPDGYCHVGRIDDGKA